MPLNYLSCSQTALLDSSMSHKGIDPDWKHKHIATVLMHVSGSIHYNASVITKSRLVAMLHSQLLTT